MIVCHCKGINDATIRKLAREGASSARQIAQGCQAGTDCGGCSAMIEKIVASERRDRPPTVSTLPALVAAS